MGPDNTKKEPKFLLLKERGFFDEGVIEKFRKALFQPSGCLLSKATEKIIFCADNFEHHFRAQLPDSEKEAENE